jgi:hypothetical protein
MVSSFNWCLFVLFKLTYSTRSFPRKRWTRFAFPGLSYERLILLQSRDWLFRSSDWWVAIRPEFYGSSIAATIQSGLIRQSAIGIFVPLISSGRRRREKGAV